MSALVAHPAWQHAPAEPARPSTERRRPNLQLVRPGFVPVPADPAVAPATAVRPRPVVAVTPASSRGAMRLTVRGRRVVTVLALLGATALSVALGASVGLAVKPSTAAATTTVTVAAGETLWSLASASAAPGEDVRDVVEEIADLNGLVSADLVPGQELLVPAS